MTLQDYTAIESVIRQAGIEHEFSERSHLRTKVDLMVRLANSTQRHQLKLNQGADWHIDVAWRRDTEGRAIEFIDLADEE